MECNKCKLYHNAIYPCQFGRGKKSATIMVVGESPTEIENKRDEPFSGKSGKRLKSSLKKRGIDLDEVYFTYALKCPLCDEKARPFYISSCKEYLEAEIDIVSPKIIVPMGNASLKMVIGKTGITKHRGRAIEVDGRIVLPTFHPADTLRKPGYKPLLLKDLDTLKSLYENGMEKVSGVTYKILEDPAEILSELDMLENESEYLAFDIETTGKSPFLDKSKVVCISFSNRERYGVVIPLLHHESPLKNDKLGVVIKRIRKLMENSYIKKVAHNGKFDILWLEQTLDIKTSNFVFDTLLGHFIAISEELGNQGLSTLSWEYTDMGGYDNELEEFKRTLPETERNNYDNIPWKILRKYAMGDADCTFRIFNIFKPMIDANPKWKRLMSDLLMPLSYALKDVEMFGMCMDLKRAEELTIAYENELNRMYEKLHSYPEVVEIEREKLELYAKRQRMLKEIPAKERTPEQQKFIETAKKYKNYKFNFGSVQQLQELLFKRLGLETPIKTDTGAFSTNEDSLGILAKKHDLPKELLKYKKVSTLNNMFIKKLPGLVDKNGIIHPFFNTSGTVTGRLSSEDPNAQQFPRKSEDFSSFQFFHEPKSLFHSRFGENGCILQFDYSQLELRLAGVISDDGALTKAFLSGGDIHKVTASLINNVSEEEVTKAMRTIAKTINFGIIYGKSYQTLATDLFGDLPRKKAEQKAKQIITDYLATYNGLAEWIEYIKEFARENGYVETLFGRWRRLPDIYSKVDVLRAEAERRAINSPIQGTGGDMTNLSVVKTVQILKANKMESMCICTVHDSIVYDVYLPELAEVGFLVKDTMENIHKGWFKSKIPFVADAEMGNNYGSIYEVSDITILKDLSNKKLYKEWVKVKEKELQEKYEEWKKEQEKEQKGVE